jgi:cytochrome c-type biogenesis protein CcmF
MLMLCQVVLLSMLLGWDFGFVKLGASPFRSLAEAMPDAPFLRANPDFVPQNGKGLNDLLRSPWMMIHPPILFLGFALLTVPFALALAAMWKREYHTWIKPSLPWTLGANLCLLTAIFLGGYWAYVTLSFGGFWAWDPVENASLVPWLLGTAGIHAMVINRGKQTAKRSALALPILAYLAVVYETFLTRSGILGDASVHSFVDLGLYNQLLAFLFVVIAVSIAFFYLRREDFRQPEQEFKIISREFMMLSAVLLLFVLSVVIIVGTSSPIIGRLFVEAPTPPEIRFYNEWSLPIAALMLVATVLGQFIWWKKADAQQLTNALVMPVLVTCIAAVAGIMIWEVRTPTYMILVLTSIFALVGNGWILADLIRKQPKMTGGVVTHIGFALICLGALLSSAYKKPLLDSKTEDYNAAVKAGVVKDENGFQVMEGVNLVKLNRNVPVVIGGKHEIVYKGMEIRNADRQFEQVYDLQVGPAGGAGYMFRMAPVVYPMAGSAPGKMNWGVDPEVKAGIFSDIYLYVAGSSYIERVNKNAAAQTSVNEEDFQRWVIKRGGFKTQDDLKITFSGFEFIDSTQAPKNAILAIRAKLDVEKAGNTTTVKPLYAIVEENGGKFGYSTPVRIDDAGLEIRFNNVNPNTDEIELLVYGLTGSPAEEDWVLLIAEEKPMISMVWLGTFLLMGGFSIAVMRRWSDSKTVNETNS